MGIANLTLFRSTAESSLRVASEKKTQRKRAGHCARPKLFPFAALNAVKHKTEKFTHRKTIRAGPRGLFYY
jgi:hypothetical protein